jgi:hypothetical protein
MAFLDVYAVHGTHVMIHPEDESGFLDLDLAVAGTSRALKSTAAAGADVACSEGDYVPSPWTKSPHRAVRSDGVRRGLPIYGQQICPPGLGCVGHGRVLVWQTWAWCRSRSTATAA